ncbi:MAG: AraC family transcriptional regulator [Bacillota bacterium]
MREYQFDKSNILRNGICNFFDGTHSFYPNVHKQIEIMYVERGSITLILPQSSMKLEENEFVIIPPFIPHTFRNRTGDANNSYISPVLPNALSERFAHNIVEPKKGSDDSKEIIEILKFYNTAINFASNNITHYFEMLANVIMEAVFNDYNESPINPIIEYIYNNYNQKLTLESVAKACFTHRNKISRTINEHTSKNFNFFVNSLRLSKFLEIYSQYNNLPLDKIAYQVGFTSVSSFYRIFKEHYDCTPSDFMANKLTMQS